MKERKYKRGVHQWIFHLGLLFLMVHMRIPLLELSDRTLPGYTVANHDFYTRYMHHI